MDRDIVMDVAPGRTLTRSPKSEGFGRISLSALLGIARQMRQAPIWPQPLEGYTTPKRDKVTMNHGVVSVPIPRRIARRMRSHA